MMKNLKPLMNSQDIIYPIIKQFIKIEKTRFRNEKHEHIPIKPLYNKYFNQPDETNLIAIIRHNDHKIKHLYYDIVNDKFFCFKKGIYIEIEQHKRSKDYKAKIIYFKDIDGKKTSISSPLFNDQGGNSYLLSAS